MSSKEGDISSVVVARYPLNNLRRRMMNKNLIILCSSLLLAACASTSEISNETPVKPSGAPPAEAPGDLAEHHCTPRVDPPTPTCPPFPPAVVTLNLVTMNATPPVLCVRPGTTVEMQLVPPPPAIGTVFVVPKEIDDYWLVGTNFGPANRIFITVPTDVTTEADYDYGFITADGKCADPRFRVE
jgi:hypothetical protein